MDSQLIIGSLTCKDYLDLHSLLYSEDSMKYEDPEYSIPTTEQIRKWWKEKVENDAHMVKSVIRDGAIVGILHAFDFKDDRCEIGIKVFPKSNWNKGIAKKAIKQFISYLIKERQVRQITAWTNVKNTAALKVFYYLDFVQEKIVSEGTTEWAILRYGMG